MGKISELKTEKLIYNRVIYDRDAERNFAKHSHSFVEIIYVLSGEVSYTIEHQKFTATAGDLILVKPYAYHFFSVIGNKDYEKLGLLLHEREIEIDSLTSQPFLLLPCASGRIHDIFGKIDFYYQNCPQKTFEDLALALAKEIILNIMLFHRQNFITTHNPIHPIIERALDFINDKLFSVTTVKEWADGLDISEGYFKTLFNQQMKISPKKYLTDKKMQIARSMIRSGTAPVQAAFQCGYSNYVTFYRLYIKMFGVNPAEDRNNTPSPQKSK